MGNSSFKKIIRLIMQDERKGPGVKHDLVPYDNIEIIIDLSTRIKTPG